MPISGIKRNLLTNRRRAYSKGKGYRLALALEGALEGVMGTISLHLPDNRGAQETLSLINVRRGEESMSGQLMRHAVSRDHRPEPGGMRQGYVYLHALLLEWRGRSTLRHYTSPSI